MNIKDLQAFTLVGPTWENLIYNPLAVLSLDSQVFINATMVVLKYFNDY